jgi:hypothetical protein
VRSRFGLAGEQGEVLEVWIVGELGEYVLEASEHLGVIDPGFAMEEGAEGGVGLEDGA